MPHDSSLPPRNDNSRPIDDPGFRREGASAGERRRKSAAKQADGSENPDTTSSPREHAENLGGQDSRDQSPKERHSLLGREGGEGEAVAAPSYPSDTRERFSREYAELQRKEAARRPAVGGGDYDGNWTRDTDKPSQPGPAS